MVSHVDGRIDPIVDRSGVPVERPPAHVDQVAQKGVIGPNRRKGAANGEGIDLNKGTVVTYDE